MRCMWGRSKKLEEKYLPHIIAKKGRGSRKWIFVTLTGITIDRGRLPEYAKRLTDVASDFLREEYPEGGLLALEYSVFTPQKTVDGSNTGYRDSAEVNLHVHAIAYGGFKYMPKFEERWAARLRDANLLHMSDIERTGGRRWVWLSVAKRVKNALRYVLKYIAKGIGLSDEEVEQLKRQKYVRSWGCLYGVKGQRYDLVCADCLVSCCIVFEESYVIGNVEPPDGRTLRIIRVPKPPPWLLRKLQ